MHPTFSRVLLAAALAAAGSPAVATEIQLEQGWNADPRRNPAMPSAGGEQDGLGHAIGLALLQRVAGLQGLRIAAEHVGVVAHPVAYRVVQRDRLVTRFRRIPPGFFRELHHHRVVTIHEAAGL